MILYLQSLAGLQLLYVAVLETLRCRFSRLLQKEIGVSYFSSFYLGSRKSDLSGGPNFVFVSNTVFQHQFPYLENLYWNAVITWVIVSWWPYYDIIK